MDLTQYELLILAGSLVGGWLKFQGEYSRLDARVKLVESDHNELKADLKHLLNDIQEIKLLLAKNKVL